MTIRETAAHYRSLGFYVQPVWGFREGACGCGSSACILRDQGKHAPHAWDAGRKDGSFPPEDFPPDANIAIRAGMWGGEGHLVILDLDRAVPSSFLEMLPSTRIHKSPRGFHYFYHTPHAFLLKNWNDVWNTWQGGAGKWWMDLRVMGGRVLAPPSVTPHGTYAFVKNAVPVAPLPLFIYERLLAAGQGRKSVRGDMRRK